MYQITDRLLTTLHEGSDCKEKAFTFVAIHAVLARPATRTTTGFRRSRKKSAQDVPCIRSIVLAQHSCPLVICFLLPIL